VGGFDGGGCPLSAPAARVAERDAAAANLNGDSPRAAGGRAAQVARSGGNGGESRRTVIVALAANLAIALAKLVGGLIAGSSAMLSEAAHSAADTMNQIFLLVSLRFSEREPDVEHPFGYGKERFFWAFMAAVTIFVSGAVFSAFQGIERITASGSAKESFGVAYAVLGFSLVAEGISLLRAIRQTREEAARTGRPQLEYVRRSRDPTTKTVLFEDTAAVVGVVLALGGVAMNQITGDPAWDGVASLAIAALLAVVAFGLGHQTYELLIGRAADPEERAAIIAVLERHPGVVAVVDLFTMVLAPDRLLVAAQLDVADECSGDDVERMTGEIEAELREEVPTVWRVFLDPTPRDGA
jgi:cation diffusion facilitator family transporter